MALRSKRDVTAFLKKCFAVERANKKTVKERIENFMEKHEIWIEDYQAGDVNGTLLDLIESCIDVLCYYLLLDIHLKFNPGA